MRRASRWAAALLAGGLAAASPAAAETYDPEGLWLTENERSAIRIARCESGLCGRVAWIVDDGMRRDSKHPKKDERGRPLCQLKILWGLEQEADDPNSWTGGTVYKADSGEKFGLDLTMKGPDTLKVRGYVGISLFGKTQIWTRVSPAKYPPCGRPQT